MSYAGTTVKDHAHVYIHVPPTKAGEKFRPMLEVRQNQFKAFPSYK